MHEQANKAAAAAIAAAVATLRRSIFCTPFFDAIESNRPLHRNADGEPPGPFVQRRQSIKDGGVASSKIFVSSYVFVENDPLLENICYWPFGSVSKTLRKSIRFCEFEASYGKVTFCHS